MNWADCKAVERRKEVLSGAWIFEQTRVPVSALFENLEYGATVDEFLAWFPGVTKDQIDQVLDFAAESLNVAV